METIPGKGETGLLTPLFEARLQLQSDMELVVPTEIREGELIGSGDGPVTGASLSSYEAILVLLGAQVGDLWLYRQCAPKTVLVPMHSAPALLERRKEGA